MRIRVLRTAYPDSPLHTDTNMVIRRWQRMIREIGLQGVIHDHGDHLLVLQLIARMPLPNPVPSGEGVRGDHLRWKQNVETVETLYRCRLACNPKIWRSRPIKSTNIMT